MKNNFIVRDQAILVGLYLSKFDNEAIQALGFEGTNEAFNTIGYAIGSKPASLKNYRDEFDPYFPNPRKGWHKRPLRDYCKVFLDKYGVLDFFTFTDLIKSFLFPNQRIEKFVAAIEKRDYTTAITKRLLTGNAAEAYFKTNYSKMKEFQGFEISDTTKNACGFDFKLDLNNQFYCIEVKGLNTLKGGISLTEKEHLMATKLTSKYCLFVVSNFIEKPQHKYFFDPLNCGLTFSKMERQVIQTTYNTQL